MFDTEEAWWLAITKDKSVIPFFCDWLQDSGDDRWEGILTFYRLGYVVGYFIRPAYPWTLGSRDAYTKAGGWEYLDMCVMHDWHKHLTGGDVPPFSNNFHWRYYSSEKEAYYDLGRAFNLIEEPYRSNLLACTKRECDVRS